MSPSSKKYCAALPRSPPLDEGIHFFTCKDADCPQVTAEPHCKDVCDCREQTALLKLCHILGAACIQWLISVGAQWPGPLVAAQLCKSALFQSSPGDLQKPLLQLYCSLTFPST